MHRGNIGVMAAAVAGLAVATPLPARAEGGNFGAGIILGSPSGLSFKYWVREREAMDAGFAASLFGSHGWRIHADYLWVVAVLARDTTYDLGAYAGAGGRILQHARGKDRDDDLHLGVRGPIGLVFDFSKGGLPLDVFVEGALLIDFRFNDDSRDPEGHGNLGAELDLALGVRYFF